MKNALLFFIILLSFSACKVQQVSTSEKISDSVNTSYIQRYKDTTIRVYIPKQQVMNVTIVNEVNGVMNSDTSTLTTEHAISKAWVRDGKLFHELNTVNEEKEVTVKNAIRETSKEVERKHAKEQVKVVEVKTNIIKWWQKILMFAGVAGIVFVAFRFGRYFYFRN